MDLLWIFYSFIVSVVEKISNRYISLMYQRDRCFNDRWRFALKSEINDEWKCFIGRKIYRCAGL